MHEESYCQAVLHTELPSLIIPAPGELTAPPSGVQTPQELRSLIQIQYSFFQSHSDYVYNPSALSEYYSYDPWQGLMLP